MVTRTSSELPGIALNVQDGNAPDWVQLIPAGPRIVGRDGRRWTMPSPETVIAAFNSESKRPQVDIEHSSQLLGSKGHPAPAVGWIEEVELRDGAIWGRVDWNDEGRNAVATRAYRYLSPVFRFDPRTGEVRSIVSAGLTNTPNLELAALNAAEQENAEMMDPAVLEALGLNSTATAADAVVAIARLTEARDVALNAAAVPDPGKWVPKADHDLALNRITEFETAERTREDEAINAAVGAAIEAGKIAPASRDYHVAACRAEGGLDRFTAAMGVTPAIAKGSDLDKKKPGADAKALTPDELAVCHQFGMTEDDFIAAKGKA